MAWISRGCSSQKSAIWSKVSEVFSTSHTAVALGINGAAMLNSDATACRRAKATPEQRSKKVNRYIVASPRPGKTKGEREGRDESDLEPRRKPAQPNDLTLLGIAELEAYIAELEAEIARVRAEIAAKLGQRRGAEALFKR